MTHQTNSAEETQKIASQIAQQVKDGGVIALSGPLGAGKTTFTQGFALALGIKGKLISPTFVLLRNYPIPGNSEGQLFHIDLYRLENNHQIESIGLPDILSNPKNIVLIEWADKLDKLPENTTQVRIRVTGDHSREIEIN